MIRNLVKVGSITAAASAVVDLSIPVGHNGTICGFYFQCFTSGITASQVDDVKAAISKINLSVTHQSEGGFALLNDVTPTFLYARELYYAGTRGVTNGTGCLHYDPSAAMRGGELAANVRNLGTKDLVDMLLRVTFASSITNVSRIDVYIDVDYNLVDNLGQHVRIGKATCPVTVAGGEVEVTTIPRFDQRFGFEAFHIHSGGLTDMTISKVSLVINGNNHLLRDIPKDVIDRSLALQDRAPQTGFTHLDFAKEDNPAYFLPGGMSELKLFPTFVAGDDAAAGTVDIWYEAIKRS
jgi:hypothetical protein